MQREQKQLLRAAARIHAGLVRRRCNPQWSLPLEAWNDLATLAGQIELARRRGWSRAAEVRMDDMAYSVESLQRRLGTMANEIRTQTDSRPLAVAADIYRDMVALHDEFEEVTCDLADHELRVTTSPIELDGFYLGPFEIRLDWEKLSLSPAYRVVALEPNQSSQLEEVTHPHVCDGHLCEGEGTTAIRSALREGRIGDFFLIVLNLLRTYSTGNAYVELDNWNGTACDSCGCYAAADTCWSCDSCGSTVCEECRIGCNSCDDSFCPNCIPACTHCQDSCCSSCLTACSECHRNVCLQCLVCAKRLLKNDNPRRNAMKSSWNQQFPSRPVQPGLRFSPTAWAKLLYLRDRGTSEVGGFGVARPDDLLYVVDIQTVHQVCSVVSVQFDDDAVARFLMRQVDAGRQPGAIRPNLVPYPSRNLRPTERHRRRDVCPSLRANRLGSDVHSVQDRRGLLPVAVQCRAGRGAGGSGERQLPERIHRQRFCGLGSGIQHQHSVFGRTAKKPIGEKVAAGRNGAEAGLVPDRTAVKPVDSSGDLLRDHLQQCFGWSAEEIDSQLELGWTLEELVNSCRHELEFCIDTQPEQRTNALLAT